MRDALIEFWRNLHPGVKIGGGLLVFWGLAALLYARKPVD